MRRFRYLLVSAFLTSSQPALAQNGAEPSADQIAQSLVAMNSWVNNAYTQLDSRLKGDPKTAVENLQRLWLQGRNAACGIRTDPADQERWIHDVLSDASVAACALNDTSEQAFRIKSIYAIFEVSTKFSIDPKDPKKRALADYLRKTIDKVDELHFQIKDRLSDSEKPGMDKRRRNWLDQRNKSCGINANPTDKGKWVQSIVSDYDRVFCAMLASDYQAIQLKVELANTPLAGSRKDAVAPENAAGKAQMLLNANQMLDGMYARVESNMSADDRADLETKRQTWLYERNRTCDIDANPSNQEDWAQAAVLDIKKLECALGETYNQMSKVSAAPPSQSPPN